MAYEYKVPASTPGTFSDSTPVRRDVSQDADLSMFVQGKTSKLVSPRGLWAKYEITITEDEIQSLRKEMWGVFAGGE